MLKKTKKTKHKKKKREEISDDPLKLTMKGVVCEKSASRRAPEKKGSRKAKSRTKANHSDEESKRTPNKQNGGIIYPQI